MAAGLGFKTFTTGEVLTAADTNGYLMQGVNVFADAAARDAAITSPQEGQFAYLKDTNVTTYYTGSAWANLDTTGMTNPMTTTGDTIYSSSGSTPARLGIGTAGQVLTVNSGATAPEWATPSSGSMTLLSTTTLSGATVTISSISQSYKSLYMVITGVTNATATNQFRCAPNGVTTISSQVAGDTRSSWQSWSANYAMLSSNGTTNGTFLSNANNAWEFRIENYTSTSSYKPFTIFGGHQDSTGQRGYGSIGVISTNTEITSLVFSNSGGNLLTGTVLLYGVN